MTPQIPLLFLIMISFGVEQTLECSVKNTSCNGIKTTTGYEFKHGGSGGRELYVYHNETLIAHARLDTQSFKLWNGVLNIDNYSVITKDCRDLTIKMVAYDKLGHVEETCVDFRTTASAVDSDSIDFSSLAMWILLILFVIACVVGYIFWKKKWRKQRDTAPVTVILRKILTCSRERNVTNRGEREETRNLNEPQNAGDLETQHNNDIRKEQSSDRSPRGSGTTNAERNNTLESVLVQRADALDGGQTSVSLRLDHHLSTKIVQPTKNGTIPVPDADRAAHHRTMNRNLRDDPGGVNRYSKEDIEARYMDSERPIDAGAFDVEDETEGRQLLLNQRAAIPGPDRTGQATALVDKHSFDPEHVSRCSTAPDTDVESHEEIQALVEQP